MKEKLVNQYSVSKTLRFALNPIGKTEEFFNERIMKDEVQRDEYYPEMKDIMDRYYKEFIDTCLDGISEMDISEYVPLYSKNMKTPEDREKMSALEEKYRKCIAGQFTDAAGYKVLDKPGEFVKKVLPDYIAKGTKEEEILDRFKNFGTFFVGYKENRANMFVADAKATSIAYRCINENLSKFIDNMMIFHDRVLPNLSEENISMLNDDMEGFIGINVKDVFEDAFFAHTLSQRGIENYNRVLGGYSNSDETKIKGLNEYINLYNQQLSSLPKEIRHKKRIPVLKPLYKQILSDRDTVSFIPEAFPDDQSVLDAIRDFYLNRTSEDSLCIREVIESLLNLTNNLSSYDLSGIMFANGPALTTLSQKVLGDWNKINSLLEEKYDSEHEGDHDSEVYFEKRKKALKQVAKYTICELETLIGNNTITAWFAEEGKRLMTVLEEAFHAVERLLSVPYEQKKKLQNNADAISPIKGFLDVIKEIEFFVKPLCATGADGAIDAIFYSDFMELFDQLKETDYLYDRVRNYITAKPYSKDKMKVMFNKSDFLTGWGQTYDTKSAHILMKNDKEYYLVIVDSKLSAKDSKFIYEDVEENPIDKIVYQKQKPDNKNTPRLFIRSKGTNYAPAVEKYQLPIEDIIDLYDKGLFKVSNKNEEERKKAVAKLIDYFKLGFTRHEDYKCFEYLWRDTAEYNTINEFYDDTIRSCYRISKEKVNFEKVKKLADEGKLYLFRIYCKDFSEHSTGRPNLHTQYFRMLFDDRNMDKKVYQLMGGAEMFYRKASINDDERIIHKANEPIANKNKLNEKKESLFDYDLIKNRRFTQRQFSIHIPVKFNFNAENELKINDVVRKEIRRNGIPHVIGIDRGERNLVYVVVLDPEGKTVYKKSLNEIISTYSSQGKTVEYHVDYQGLLADKEAERNKARKEWASIENIKELKEGYISQVVNEVCRLAIHYDAIIALEDLNSGFKNSRKKVERQVYDKFETMLRTKLEYYVEKEKNPEETGGFLNAYQLTTNKHYPSSQDGIMFFVPAWLTSKIDPTTGFVNLLYPKYTSVATAKDFLGHFKDIRYNKESDMFEFEFDYRDFPACDSSFRKEWTVCTNGERIRTFRDKNKNNEWSTERVNLTDAFKKVFDSREIDYSDTLYEKILEQSDTDKEFYSTLLSLIKLMLQMRNSVPNSTDPEDDYLISPVRNESGLFFDTRNVGEELPTDADANGAYHIAKKAQWAAQRIIEADENDYKGTKISVSKAEWLEYCQNR